MITTKRTKAQLKEFERKELEIRVKDETYYEQEIDILVTDINMPYNSGLELIQYIKSNLSGKVPVIIVSGINLEETKQHAKELGAVNYVTKPFDPEILVEMIQKITNK